MFTKQSRRNPLEMFFWRNHCFLVRVRHKQPIKWHFIKLWNSPKMVIQFKADADHVRSLWYLAMINTVRSLQGDPAPSPVQPAGTRLYPDCLPHWATLYYNEATWHKFCSVTNFQSRWNARYHLSKLAPNIVIIVWQDYLPHEAMQNKTAAMILSYRLSLSYPPPSPWGWGSVQIQICSGSHFHWGLMSDVPVFITSVALCALYWRIQLISLSSLSSPQKINNNYNTDRTDHKIPTQLVITVTHYW